MRYLYILSLLLISYSLFGQDVLIKSSQLTTDVTAKDIPIKPDSLVSANPRFIQTFKKTTKQADGPLLNSKENAAISNPLPTNDEQDVRAKINANSNEERRAVEAQERADAAKNEELKKTNKEQAIKMAEVEKAKNDLEKLNIENKRQAFILFSVNKEQNERYNIINSNKTALVKIVSELKATKDSLGEIKKQVDLSRRQIKNSEFKFASLYSLFDTTFNRKSRVAIIDTLANFSAVIYLLGEQARSLSTDISTSISAVETTLQSTVVNERLLDSLNVAITALVPKKDSLTSADIDKIQTESQAITKNFNNITVKQNKEALDRIRSSYKSYGDIYFSDIKKNYDAINKRYVSFYNERFKENVKQDEVEFGAFPNITSIIGEQRALNLNISILGAYTTQNKDAFASFEARLFTGNVPKGLANARSLFIPEASSFGTQMKFTGGLKITGENGKRSIVTNVGGIFELNLLSKRLGSINSLSATTPSSSTSITDDLNNFVVHARLAGEVVVVKEVFSIYGSANWLALVDNTQRFREYYRGLSQVENQTSWYFFDVGGRIMLNPAGGDAKKLIGSDLKIVADFSFIIPKLWGRQLINGVNDVTRTDMFLPVIRIGVRKSLGFIHRQ